MTPGTGTEPATPPEPDQRRRRIRNWALLIALMSLAALFYAIAMVRMAAEHSLPYFR
jgi:fatty acid desaturase